MELFVLFLAVFGSKRDEHGGNKEKKGEHEITMVKIEEDKDRKGRHSSQFIGVSWKKSKSKWQVSRRSKIQGKTVCNGSFNVDKETKAAHASDTLARALIANGEDHKLNFPDDETEVWEERETSSKYFGVSWIKIISKWQVQRWSKIQKKGINNGSFNVDEEIKAAHASDTLARALMANGERQKLNFPNDEAEVWPEEKETSSKYFGVSWNKTSSKWQVSRKSNIQGKTVYNGHFNVTDEIKAAHASDTLARALISNGEEDYKLNFPNDETEVWAEREPSSKYLGVSWNKKNSKWRVQRWSKIQGKNINNGCFSADEETKAAHASDTLARELIANSEDHKLNFPNDETEVWAKRNKKRKRTNDLKPQND